MGVKVQASVLYKEHDLRVVSRELADPSAGEVQVAVKCTTLCGSDMHYYQHGRNGDFKVKEPLSLGHESAGIITAVGDGVTDLKVGDKVALEVGTPCGNCKICRKGRYNLCSNMKFRSSAKSYPHYQGTLQQRINCGASWCHKLPENLKLEHGALLEPLAVAIHAANRANLYPGCSVLVLGAGAVGLLSAAVAKANGATTIAIADISKERVDFAVKNGFATNGHVVPLKRGASTEEKLEIAQALAKDLNELPDKDDPSQTVGQFDFTFECTGVESCVQAGIYATATGGRLMFVGMGNPIQTLHLGAAALREVDLLGVFRYANAYPAGIHLMASGKIPALDDLITHKVTGLDHVEDAFKLASKPVDDKGQLVIKVAVFTE